MSRSVTPSGPTLGPSLTGHPFPQDHCFGDSATDLAWTCGQPHRTHLAKVQETFRQSPNNGRGRIAVNLNHWKQRDRMRILSVDGGGYLGLATAEFIAGIEAHFGVSFHQEFEFFCGTSTGALISLALAVGSTGAQIVELYRCLGQTVFQPRTDVPRRARLCPGIFRAKYSSAPLEKTLNEFFEDRTVGDVLLTGKRILVTSFSVSAGEPRIFKTDHAPQLSLHNSYRLRDIALASAAAPVFFPLARIQNPANGVVEVFCDGGVVSNHPALLGYAEAVYQLGISPADIRLLSISTPRVDLSQSPKDLDRGLRAWKETLPAIMLDSPAKIAHETIRRLVASCGPNQPRYERIALPNPQKIAFDCATAEATACLRQIGAGQAAQTDVRNRLARLWQP